MSLKTFLICSDTNYGEFCHIINAETEEEALKLAADEGAWDFPSIQELNTEARGLVATCGGGGG